MQEPKTAPDGEGQELQRRANAALDALGACADEMIGPGKGQVVDLVIELRRRMNEVLSGPPSTKQAD